MNKEIAKKIATNSQPNFLFDGRDENVKSLSVNS
jgi:flagellar hook-associated protein FlgK